MFFGLDAVTNIASIKSRKKSFDILGRSENQDSESLPLGEHRQSCIDDAMTRKAEAKQNMKQPPTVAHRSA